MSVEQRLLYSMLIGLKNYRYYFDQSENRLVCNLNTILEVFRLLHGHIESSQTQFDYVRVCFSVC